MVLLTSTTFGQITLHPFRTYKNMKLKTILLALSVLTASITLVAQQKISPNNIKSFGAIKVNKPILLDSTNLKNNKFSDDMILDYSIAFPEHNRFTNEIKPDTVGFFNLSRPTEGLEFQLLSFFISGNKYGKGKITVTSPNKLELWIDGNKKASKTTVNDSIHQSGSVDASIDGFTSNSRVIVKLLASAEDNLSPSLKIEVSAEQEDSLMVYTFDDVVSRRINIKDIIEGSRVHNSSISASGRFILLRLSTTIPGGRGQSNIEVYDTREKRIVMSETSSRQMLNWMPESDLLYYVEDSENGRTLYTLNPTNNSTSILADNIPREGFRFAPDEKSIFFSTKESIEVSNPNGLNRLIGIDDRQPSYRDRYYINRLFLDSGLTQQLTFGKQSASINDITKDASKLLFTVSEQDLSERPFRKNSLYMLNFNSMHIDTIWQNERFAGYAQFSPDGEQLVIQGGPESFEGIGLNIKEGQIANSYDTQSFIMDLKTRIVTPITKDFDPSISSQFWNKADNNIYYRTEDKDRVTVYRYSPKNSKFEKLPLNEDVIQSFNISNNGRWATYTGVSVSNSNRSYLLDMKTMKSTLISDPYGDKLNTLNLGEVKDWTFKSSYGDEIDGRYYLPPNFDASKKYPLIVYYYGGTSPTTRGFESTYPLHVYAAQDYVVYALQPSGTTGYGQEFSARHVNAWGKQTAEEIIEGVLQFVDAHPFVDGTKIGNIGASYGGFMTQYLITQTDMFDASVSHAGISNITSYWGEGYWGYSYSSAASAESYPWNNPEMYVEQSPLYNADKINTPLMLLHGTADTNVPMGESIQMYTAMKLLGKEVEFIQVEGENHAIYDYTKRISWNNAIYAWFAKWLKEDTRWWDSMFSESN